VPRRGLAVELPEVRVSVLEIQLVDKPLAEENVKKASVTSSIRGITPDTSHLFFMPFKHGIKYSRVVGHAAPLLVVTFLRD